MLNTVFVFDNEMLASLSRLTSHRFLVTDSLYAITSR